jgi:hypothetical protein
MEEKLLISWRNHIVDSFRDDANLSHPLRFLRLNGVEPTLTILRMGSKSEGPEGRKRTASRVKEDEEKGKGKGKGRTSKKGKTSKKGRKSKSVVSDESDSSSDDDSSDGKPLVKRPKLHRTAGDKAKTGIQDSIKLL